MTPPDEALAVLHEGITVLEASAGTGKTHRVTTEAVRAVAAGTPLEQMLLVTFTIAATSELRARTWDRSPASCRWCRCFTSTPGVCPSRPR